MSADGSWLLHSHGAGYQVTRQTSAHVRLTTREGGEHHITVPDHAALRTGTLAGIIGEVASPLGTSRDELLRKLFPRARG